MQKSILMLENGEVFHGYSIGYKDIVVGEIVFNTALTGYQEIITDPSYKNQIITFTYPHIGNVGVNSEDNESNDVYISGLILNEVPTKQSNWRAQDSLKNFLVENKVVCIAGIDTRYLTSLIREKGSLNACISSSNFDIEYIKKELVGFSGIEGSDLAKVVSTKEKYTFEEYEYGNISHKKLKRPYNVVAYDFGVKKNILRILYSMGCNLTIVPAETSANEVMEYNPDGIFLSNGPGDPEPCKYAIESIKTFFKNEIPIFGICLGHQLMSLASGARTRKMSHGHHGANHPVIDLKLNKVLITSQNHGFVVEEKSLPNSMEITHRSLFDNTIQGLKHKTKPFFSFQGHPEASPGPQDVKYLFENFIVDMKKYICQKEKI